MPASAFTLDQESINLLREVVRLVIGEQEMIFRRPDLNTYQNDFQESLLLCKTAEAISASSSGSVTLFGKLGEAQGSETTLNESFTAYNRGGALDNNAWVIVAAIGSGYEILSGAGGGGCTAQNAIHQLTILGSPTNGTFDYDITLDSSSDTLTFNYDDDATEVKTEILTHADSPASGDITVSGGPFPDATIEIEFTGDLAETDIKLGVLDWSGLTGGTGVGTIASLAQRGFA